MPAFGTKRTSPSHSVMSAFGSKADIAGPVRFETTPLYSTDDQDHSAGQKYRSPCACSPHRAVQRGSSRCDDSRIKTQADRAAETPLRPSGSCGPPPKLGPGDPLPRPAQLQLARSGKFHIAGIPEISGAAASASVASYRAKRSSDFTSRD